MSVLTSNQSGSGQAGCRLTGIAETTSSKHTVNKDMVSLAIEKDLEANKHKTKLSLSQNQLVRKIASGLNKAYSLKWEGKVWRTALPAKSAVVANIIVSKSLYPGR